MPRSPPSTWAEAGNELVLPAARRGRIGSILRVDRLNVHYGRAHAVQDVSLTLDRGILAVVGRNGMGKTTLCNAITGLVAASGQHQAGRSPRSSACRLTPSPASASAMCRRAAACGRRSRVDEHLRLAARSAHRGLWTIERIYDLFPRLAERRGNGGFQLSGGEQQMLAIGRALLFNPRLLVMDEPTEGLAPVIVEQVAETLKSLGDDALSVLLVEQNLGVAIDVADTVAVMVNGRIARIMPASELAADTDLQQRLLGVAAGGDAEDSDELVVDEAAPAEAETRIFTVRRATDEGSMPEAAAAAPVSEERAVRGLTRWNACRHQCGAARPDHQRPGESSSAPPSFEVAAASLATAGREARVVELPVAATFGRAAYIAGTFDTKGRELGFLRNCLEKLGLRTVTVDLATSGAPSPASVPPREVARHHPDGERAVFTVTAVRPWRRWPLPSSASS